LEHIEKFLKKRDIANYKGLYCLSYVDKSYIEDKEEPENE
jgi:hypothetical protein